MEIDQLSKQLEKTCLTQKEALVYSTLLNLGGAFPSKIAEMTKIKRSTVYKVLLDLSVKGLVNEIEKRGKLFYQLEKPSNLIRFAKNRIRIATEEAESLNKIIPDIEGLFSAVSNKPKVKYFEGPDTIQSICDDMVSEKRYEMLAFSNAEKFKNILTPKKLREFIQNKVKREITTRAIVPDSEGGRTYSQTVFGGIDKKYWPVVRFVPSEIFPFEAELTIYGKNKVSITKLSKENIIGVIIEDDTIYGMMKMIFEIAWEGKTIKA